MFDNLSEKLGNVFDKLKIRGSLSEKDVDAAMREIRIALLEADVALPVVKKFIEDVRERAIGQEIVKSVSPGQQVVKIVNDAIIELLGDENQSLNLHAKPPIPFLMVGLQGSGKTTTTAKIAKFLTDKENRQVLMASLDTYRPAAQDQLRTLGEQTGIATLPIVPGQNPVEIAKRAMQEARQGGYDIVMLDTAGRLSIDDDLMKEVEAIRDTAQPVETLLVADAMSGQDAVTTATNFNDRVGISGVILTRIDGDARGGAAMSMRAVTGKPIKFLGTGEKWDALEPFYPDRIASRILGMGDVVSLVEKATETIDQEAAEKMAEKFQKGEFDFEDYLSQIQSMKKMGGLGSLMKMIPGIGKMASQMGDKAPDDDFLKKQEAIIQSMTKKERAKPALLNASRKKRIASGSGTSVQDVNKLSKQHQQMHGMMKKMRKMGMGNMMKEMQGMMGGQDAQMLEQLKQTDPAFFNSDAGKQGQNAPALPGLGGNLSGGGLPGMGGLNPFGGFPGGGPDSGGGYPDMPGQGAGKRGVTKKIKKRKKRK